MKPDFSKLIIAIDGPAGAGKSSVARLVAERCKLTYIDSGAMYRAITWLAMQEKIDLEKQKDFLVQKAKEVQIKLLPSVTNDPERLQRVLIDNTEITREIRNPEITKMVSVVSAIPEIRARLVELQQELGKNGGVIMDGRDIGTAVFPNADLKVFLVASSTERATRRQKQLASLGIHQKIDAIKAEIEKRDYFDCNREASPLRQAEDAILVDTDGLTVEEVVERIVSLIKEKALAG